MCTQCVRIVSVICLLCAHPPLPGTALGVLAVLLKVPSHSSLGAGLGNGHWGGPVEGQWWCLSVATTVPSHTPAP